MVRRSLGVPEDGVTDAKTRERMQALLAANVLVYGTLKPVAQGSPSVGLTVTMVDAVSAQERASFDEDLGEGGKDLSEKSPAIAERLRGALGVSLSDAEASALSASRPHSILATKPYAQGVLRLRNFEYARARGDFEAAVAADGDFLDAQRRAAKTWEAEGNRRKASEALARISSRTTGLTPRQRAETNAYALRLDRDPSKGEAARQALFDATPDDVELGLGLAEESSRGAASALLSRLRALPPPVSSDIRLDIVEADVAWLLGDFERARDILKRAEDRAQAIGARAEHAYVVWERAEMLWSGERRGVEALERFKQAATILGEIGQVDDLADVAHRQAVLLSNIGSTTATLKASEECAVLYRRIGRLRWLSDVLVLEARELLLLGDLDRCIKQTSRSVGAGRGTG